MSITIKLYKLSDRDEYILNNSFDYYLMYRSRVNSFGKLINLIMDYMSEYIYSFDKIEVIYYNRIVYRLGHDIRLNDNILQVDRITSINFYERRRDIFGNVLPSNILNFYSEYITNINNRENINRRLSIPIRFFNLSRNTETNSETNSEINIETNNNRLNRRNREINNEDNTMNNNNIVGLEIREEMIIDNESDNIENDINRSRNIITDILSIIPLLRDEINRELLSVDIINDVRIVAKDSDIEKLEKKLYKEIKDKREYPDLDRCHITLNEFNDESELIVLPCKHYFEKESIIKWLKENSVKCPICRLEVCQGSPLL